MFEFFGIVLILSGLAMLLVKMFSIKEDVVKQERSHRNSEMINVISQKKSPDWMIKLKTKFAIPLMAIGFFIMLIPSLFFFADRGYNYLLVFPNGKMSAVMDQGIKLKLFAKIDPWQKFIDVKVIGENVEYDADELEGMMHMIDLRFIDQVTAKGLVSTRFQLPENKEKFIKLAVEFRSMSNLVNNTIIPTIKEQLVQTAYMFAAQDYISGEAQSFRQTFEQQLKNGTFKVNKREERDTVYGPIERKGEQRLIKEIRTTYHVDKELDVNGIPIRIPHEVTENGIIVSQVIVDQLILDPTFKKRLEKQRDESALRQLEQQKIKTAKSTQQRIIAEGERDKSAERVTQEKEQVKKLIAIETKLKEEKTNKELAAIALETQKLKSKTVKVKADADAYEIAKKVFAGITPEKELQMKLDAGVAKWAEIAKMKWPEKYVNINGGSGSTESGTLETLIKAAMANQLLEGKPLSLPKGK